MALDNTNVIDFVSVKDDSSNVWLTIADDFDWQDEKKHMYLLQEKINTYLEFIENGQFYKAYPEVKGRNISIEIYARFPIPEAGMKFLKRVDGVVTGAGYGFSYKHHPSKKRLIKQMEE